MEIDGHAAIQRFLPEMKRPTQHSSCVITRDFSGWLNWLSALLSVVVFSLSAVAAAYSQAPTGRELPSSQLPQLIPRSQADKQRVYQSRHRVVLNVNVADTAGKLVAGLTQMDFTILDNQKAVDIQSFRSVEVGSAVAPAQVVLVLDAVNNTLRKIGYVRRELEKYLKDGDGPLTHPTSIAVLSDTAMRQGQVTQARSALLGDLRSFTADLQESECANKVPKDRDVLPVADGVRPVLADPKLDCQENQFYSSLTGLASLVKRQSDVPVRVILIWIGQGWPILADRGYSPDTPSLKQGFFNNLVEISGALRDSQVTLSAIASPEPSYGPNSRILHDAAFFEGVPNENEVTAGSLGLHPLAHQSGGQIHRDTKGIAGQIATCIADAELYYVLSFDSPPAARYGEYHSLEVKVGKPELKARTNTLRYAQQ